MEQSQYFILDNCDSSGFGQRVTWEDNANAKPGNHKLTFREALHTTASELVYNFVLPSWVKALPHPRLRKIKLATDELRVSDALLYISKDLRLKGRQSCVPTGLHAGDDQRPPGF